MKAAKCMQVYKTKPNGKTKPNKMIPQVKNTENAHRSDVHEQNI